MLKLLKWHLNYVPKLVYINLGQSEKETLYHCASDSVIFYNVALYDPAEYRKRAIELEKEAHRLSNLINAKNYQVDIEFDDSNYILSRGGKTPNRGVSTVTGFLKYHSPQTDYL